MQNMAEHWFFLRKGLSTEGAAQEVNLNLALQKIEEIRVDSPAWFTITGKFSPSWIPFPNK